MPGGGGGGGNGGGHRGYHKKGGGGGQGGWWQGKKRGGGGKRGGGENTKKARLEHESLKYRMGESKPHEGSYAMQQVDKNNGGGSGGAEQGELGGKKKVALVLGYCGTGFQGMQMNPGATSIEAELEKAMFEAGCIKEVNFGNLQKIAWSRAGRTDKGVHAAAQVVGCKLHVKMKEEEKKEEDKVGIKTEDGESNEVLSTPSADHAGETTETVSAQPPKQINVASWSALSTDELSQAFEDTRDAINAKLPAGIQVHGIVRATRGFNAKNDCVKRRYCYMLPTFLLQDASVVGPLVGKCVQVSRKLQQQQAGKKEGSESKDQEEDEARTLQEPEKAEAEDEDEEEGTGGDDDDDDDAAAQHGEGGDANGTAASPPARNKQGLEMSYPQPDLVALKTCFQEKLTNYRVEPARLEKFRATLRRYLGTHKFHNFSIRMSFRSGQVKRYIMDIEACDPFVREDGIEWTCVTLTGQAFLLHQIRKMVAVAVMITRGAAPEDLIETAYGHVMLTLPMAPSDGLFLDMAFFDRYNERATQIGSGSSLEWEADHSSAGKDPLLIPPPPAVILERLRAFKEAQIVGHITRSESTTLAFSKWLYHMHYRFEKKTESPFSPRELTLGEQRSETSKKEVIRKTLAERKLQLKELEQRHREQQQQEEQQQEKEAVGVAVAETDDVVAVAVAAVAAGVAEVIEEVQAASVVEGEVTQ